MVALVVVVVVKAIDDDELMMMVIDVDGPTITVGIVCTTFWGEEDHI
jgi:hypothetical protein